MRRRQNIVCSCDLVDREFSLGTWGQGFVRMVQEKGTVVSLFENIWCEGGRGSGGRERENIVVCLEASHRFNRVLCSTVKEFHEV